MSPVPDDEPALRLAVAFVNTHDLLATPPDYLTPEVAATLAARHGQDRLAAELSSADVEALRAVRGRLYAVFAGPSDADKIAAVNAVLGAYGSRAELGADRLMAVPTSADPVHRLAMVCADALAHAMATGGPARFGTCAGHPCRCGYLDRTRAARQRYCCSLCNERMAASAYRRRQAHSR